MSYYVKRPCCHDNRSYCYVYIVSCYVKRLWCYIKLACCFVHTESYVRMLCYYVKNWFILSTKHEHLSIQHAFMLNACIVLSKQLKCYVILLNARAVLSTPYLVVLK